MNRTDKLPQKIRRDAQDSLLEALRQQRIPVSVYLVNGIKLLGEIAAFDQFAVVLRSHSLQMIFKHAISTVVPSRDLEWRETEEEAAPQATPIPPPQPEPELKPEPPAALSPPITTAGVDPPRVRVIRKRKKKDAL